jgi:ketosteroid isomerase-like protein
MGRMLRGVADRMREGMTNLGRGVLVVASLVLASLGQASDGAETAKRAEQVRAREVAFAQTMADRDHDAFATFVSEEALFLGPTVLRGRAAVAAGWKPFFEGPGAPFSWEPERVEVIDSGTLAISSGPVRDPEGRRVGTFNSTWRLEGDGQWRVVIDIGCPPCRCADSSPEASGE